MISAAKPARDLIIYLELNLEAPEDLLIQVGSESFLEQRHKLSSALFSTVLCFLIVSVSAITRVLVSIDSAED